MYAHSHTKHTHRVRRAEKCSRGCQLQPINAAETRPFTSRLAAGWASSPGHCCPPGQTAWQSKHLAPHLPRGPTPPSPEAASLAIPGRSHRAATAAVVGLARPRLCRRRSLSCPHLETCSLCLCARTWRQACCAGCLRWQSGSWCECQPSRAAPAAALLPQCFRSGRQSAAAAPRRRCRRWEKGLLTGRLRRQRGR